MARGSLVSFPTDEKLALALELERRVRAGDSRIRQVVSSDYVDGFGETAIATSQRGIEVTSRQTGCYLFVHAVAGAGDDTQTGFGYSVGRGRPISTSKPPRPMPWTAPPACSGRRRPAVQS